MGPKRTRAASYGGSAKARSIQHAMLHNNADLRHVSGTQAQGPHKEGGTEWEDKGDQRPRLQSEGRRRSWKCQPGMW